MILLITTTNLLSTYSMSGMVLGVLNAFSHGLLPLALAKSFSFFGGLASELLTFIKSLDMHTAQFIQCVLSHLDLIANL